MNSTAFKHQFLYGLHLLGVIATWILPFMVSWPIALTVYAAVTIQFAVFGKCLMNEHHGLKEEGDRIFYTDVLEKMGFNPNPRVVKTVVRKYLYPSLAVVTLIYQLILGNAPLLF